MTPAPFPTPPTKPPLTPPFQWPPHPHLRRPPRQQHPLPRRPPPERQLRRRPAHRPVPRQDHSAARARSPPRRALGQPAALRRPVAQGRPAGQHPGRPRHGVLQRDVWPGAAARLQVPERHCAVRGPARVFGVSGVCGGARAGALEGGMSSPFHLVLEMCMR